MTTEEKAKAYDEALEKAKFYHGNCPSEPERKKLEKMFPVLRESEDEKIRKGLIEVVSDIAGCWPFEEHGITKKEALAYLERQKEQKPAEWSKDEKILNYLIEFIYRSDEDIFPERGGVSKLDILTYLEKQKEWKPIFKEGDMVIWDGEEFNILDVHKGAYNVGGYIVPFSRERELHPIGQKPTEWSEEDEAFLKVATAICNRYSHKDIADWLKSLRPVSKESLQPHWKPSEEQMKALETAKRWYSDNMGCNLILESLFEQLKKLM